MTKCLQCLLQVFGKISCAAKGARRQNSRLLASTQFLCFGEYILYKSQETYNINSCDPIEVFYNIRTDYDKINYTAHITKTDGENGVVYTIENKHETEKSTPSKKYKNYK